MLKTPNITPPYRTNRLIFHSNLDNPPELAEQEETRVLEGFLGREISSADPTAADLAQVPLEILATVGLTRAELEKVLGRNFLAKIVTADIRAAIEEKQTTALQDKTRRNLWTLGLTQRPVKVKPPAVDQELSDRMSLIREPISNTDLSETERKYRTLYQKTIREFTRLQAYNPQKLSTHYGENLAAMTADLADPLTKLTNLPDLQANWQTDPAARILLAHLQFPEYQKLLPRLADPTTFIRQTQDKLKSLNQTNRKPTATKFTKLKNKFFKLFRRGQNQTPEPQNKQISPKEKYLNSLLEVLNEKSRQATKKRSPAALLAELKALRLWQLSSATEKPLSLEQANEQGKTLADLTIQELAEAKFAKNLITKTAQAIDTQHQRSKNPLKRWQTKRLKEQLKQKAEERTQTQPEKPQAENPATDPTESNKPSLGKRTSEQVKEWFRRNPSKKATARTGETPTKQPAEKTIPFRKLPLLTYRLPINLLTEGIKGLGRFAEFVYGGAPKPLLKPNSIFGPTILGRNLQKFKKDLEEM